MAARILVVEDNRDNMALMTYVLEHFGHEVLAATNGRDGVQAVADHDPDLVLMDIQMPVMDGLEATALIREQRAGDDLPVIAVTALAMVGDRERLLEQGFDGYISKPIVPADFVREIDRHLASIPGGTA